MKKILGYVVLIIFLIIGGVSVVYYKNIKGALPAILAPTGDIAEVINTTDTPFVLPAGFSISLYAKDLVAPRVLSYAPSGQILVSIPREGKVVALLDKDNDGFAETHVDVASGLNSPHGLANRCEGEVCKLYIAETNQVAEYDFDKENIKATNKKKLFDLDSGGNHSSRTIMFMPWPDQDKMLVSIGSSCNVCIEKSDQRAKVLEYDFNTSKLTEFAKGLRNSVFMAIHPVSGDVWATEMGRDLLGDDIPPDEINILKKGANFGWPICYGKNIHDTNFDPEGKLSVSYGAGKNTCLGFVPSFIDIQAHSAPLGLAFFPEEGWPEEYWYNMLVAYHGSWNRTVPTGYKIVRYKLDAKGKYLGQEDFLTGFMSGGDVYGRPVDILIQPGGLIYVSDDKAGVVYKIKYSN